MEGAAENSPISREQSCSFFQKGGTKAEKLENVKVKGCERARVLPEDSACGYLRGPPCALAYVSQGVWCSDSSARGRRALRQPLWPNQTGQERAGRARKDTWG